MATLKLGTAFAQPQYGGYSYEFVTEPPERYHCSICAEIMRVPHHTQCCGQQFCKSCLTKWEKSTKSKSKTCPHCRAPKFHHMLDTGLKREIDELRVHCSQHKEGCVWVGVMAEVEAHHKACGYFEDKCTLCSLNVRCMHLDNHRKHECRHRRTECTYCHKQGVHHEITSFGHLSTCPGYPTNCPNHCGESVKRSEVEAHRNNHCPLESVKCPCCPFKVSRRDLERHVAANSQQHLVTLMMSFKETETGLATLTREFRMFQATSEDTLKQIADNVDELMKGCTEKQLPSLRSIKTLAENCSVKQLSPTHPSLTITMPNFSSYRKTASSSSHKVWHSPPFYYNNGYKMRIGASTTAATCKSPPLGDQLHLEVQLLQGEFDDKLQWPCETLCIKLSIVHPPVPTQTHRSSPRSWRVAESGTLSTPMNRCQLFASGVMWQHTILLSPLDIHKNDDSLVLKLEWNDHSRQGITAPAWISGSDILYSSTVGNRVVKKSIRKQK